MKISSMEDRTDLLISKLCAVWESSVRATHLFLSDSEIEKISGYVSTALRQIEVLIVITDNEDTPAAFMGINGCKLEMLFVSPKKRGQGIGRRLMHEAVTNHSVNELGVNEQNPQARGFYEHLGFRVYRRSETDEQGAPYPILYMRLA